MPDYIGVAAFGIKMGIVVAGCDLVAMVADALAKCHDDGLLDDYDTICLTESVVARAQNNYVTTDDIALEVRRKLNLKAGGRLGVLFPLLSRNRFSLILKGLAKAVPGSEVVVQLAYPTDEVGNIILPQNVADLLGKKHGEAISVAEIGSHRTRHPITGVDYIDLYEKVIMAAGARPYIFLCNDPLEITKYNLDGVVVANVHQRQAVKEKLEAAGQNCVTLQELCRENNGGSWSEWGLLGSNMSSEDKLKLAPRQADELANRLQALVAEKFGKLVEVIIYGDGAYQDPSTGIYELADPQPAFGMTKGLAGRYRRGVKYKYLVDELYYKGKSVTDIEKILEMRKKESLEPDSIVTEGTTPRRVEDLMASLADLVSGSADAGTPLVIIKGFIS